MTYHGKHLTLRKQIYNPYISPAQGYPYKNGPVYLKVTLSDEKGKGMV
jgi:hypothetical protein